MKRFWATDSGPNVAILLAAALAVGCEAGPLVSFSAPQPTTERSTSSSLASPQVRWTVLFDGRRTSGLRAYGGTSFPADRWQVRDGRLWTIPGAGVDLITDERFAGFELEFRWAVTPAGNSGVLYGVVESDQPAWATGAEYQILDDDGHPDGASSLTSAGALYDLIEPPTTKHLATVGADNEGRIVVRDRHVEHWLNGDLVVAYDRDNANLRTLIAASKFRDLPGFMATDEGHVVLQHHGEEVSFSRIRIRRG
jgi:hypothetical protein